MKRQYNNTSRQPYKRPRTTNTVFIGPLRRPPARTGVIKRYVPRTPGGQLIADNHYYDASHSPTSVFPAIGAWSQPNLFDPNQGIFPGSLFAPRQGDDISNRQGRKTFLKKIRIQGQITCAPQSLNQFGDLPTKIRLIIVQDKQTNGAQFDPNELILSGVSSGAIHMFQSTANLGRFKIWKDKSFTLQNPNLGLVTNPVASTIQQGISHNFKFNIKVNTWVNYNSGNSGQISDVVDNSFHVVCGCSDTTLDPRLEYKSRAVFTA